MAQTIGELYDVTPWWPLGGTARSTGYDSSAILCPFFNSVFILRAWQTFQSAGTRKIFNLSIFTQYDQWTNEYVRYVPVVLIIKNPRRISFIRKFRRNFKTMTGFFLYLCQSSENYQKVPKMSDRHFWGVWNCLYFDSSLVLIRSVVFSYLVENWFRNGTVRAITVRATR